MMRYKDILHYHERFIKFLTYLYAQFQRVGGTYRAAGLTYVTLLSLVPFLSVAISLFAVFPIMEDTGGQLQNFIINNFVPASGEVIANHLQNFLSQASTLSVTGILFLFVTAVMLIFTLEGTFNNIWRVDKGRKFLSTMILYWGILTIAPILMGIGIGLTSYLFSLTFIQDTTSTLGLQEPVLLLAPFALTFISFTLLYLAIPNRPVPFKCAMGGAFFAALLYEIAKKSFVWYVSSFPTYKLIYGAFATIPIFFLWIYISWTIILFGAILSYVFSTGYERQFGAKRSVFMQAFYWLGYLWQAQQEGKGLSFQELLCRDKNVEYTMRPEKLLSILKDNNLIKEYTAMNYMLSRDLNTFSLYELYKTLSCPLPDRIELEQDDNPWQKSLTTQLEEVNIIREKQLSASLVSIYSSTRRD